MSLAAAAKDGDDGSMRILVAVVAAAFVVFGVDVHAAAVCSPIPADRFALDPAYADDTVAPSAVSNVTYSVGRTDGGACSGHTDADCAYAGSIELAFDVSDDRAPASALFYEARVIAGTDSRITILDEPLRFPVAKRQRPGRVRRQRRAVATDQRACDLARQPAGRQMPVRKGTA
jgi:hypothetical protein